MTRPSVVNELVSQVTVWPGVCEMTLVKLLGAEQIGVTLSEEYMLEPEQSTRRRILTVSHQISKSIPSEACLI